MKLPNKNNLESSTRYINWRRKISCYVFSFLELLAIHFDFFYRLLMSWRKPIFLKEIKMAKIASNDKVLLIVTGILPSEAVLIDEEANAKVVTIDNNLRACKAAKSYIKKKGLEDKIKVDYADGKDYPVDCFNVIFIAINVSPIGEVLKNLSTNIKKGTRIMCKGRKNDIVNILENKNLNDVFSVESVMENPKSQSFLLIRK